MIPKGILILKSVVFNLPILLKHDDILIIPLSLCLIATLLSRKTKKKKVDKKNEKINKKAKERNERSKNLVNSSCPNSLPLTQGTYLPTSSTSKPTPMPIPPSTHPNLGSTRPQHLTQLPRNEQTHACINERFFSPRFTTPWRPSS